MVSSSNSCQQKEVLFELRFLKLLKELIDESIHRALDRRGVDSKSIGNRASQEIQSRGEQEYGASCLKLEFPRWDGGPEISKVEIVGHYTQRGGNPVILLG